jgi:hypothetical protein
LAERYSEEQRLQDFFWKLESMIPNPPRDWAKSAKPCKWKKILDERKAGVNDLEYDPDAHL